MLRSNHSLALRRGALGAAALTACLAAPAWGQVFPTTTALPAAVANGTCAPTELTIPVAGLTGPLTSLSATLGLQATWAGDVVAELVAPGGTASMLLVSRIGRTTPGSFGDDSNFAGNYTFVDTSVSTNDIWAAAAAVDAATAIPPGTYATSPAGAALPRAASGATP